MMKIQKQKKEREYNTEEPDTKEDEIEYQEEVRNEQDETENIPRQK